MPLKWFSSIVLPSILLLVLGACATPEQAVLPAEQLPSVSMEQTNSSVIAQPTDIDTSGDSTVTMLGDEQARDLAVTFVAEAKGLSLPTAWTLQPEDNPAGGLNVRIYTGGPWVVRVEYPASAPSVRTYAVTIDHLQAVLRWQGQVDAYGKLEGTFLQGTSPMN